jgi:hypothetical protein
MPTKKQLSDRWASEMAFGHYNNDDGYNVRGSHMAGTGTQLPSEYTGKTIGVMVYDPEKKDFKIEVNKDLE